MSVVQHHIVVRTLFLLVLLSSIGVQPPTLYSQSVPGDCRALLRKALQLRDTPGYVFYRAMHVVSYSRTGDTVETDVVSIEAKTLFIIRADSTETWQDTKSMAIVDHRLRQVQFVDLTGRSGVMAARRAYQEVFFDSLASHVVKLSCSAKEGVTHISGRVIPEKQILYKAQSIDVDIRADGEIVRYASELLEENPILKVEYNVIEINRHYDGINPDQSVRDHFLSPEKNLIGEYSQYRLIDRSRPSN